MTNGIGRMTQQLAELNIGRVRYPLDDARMAGFVDNLALVNGLAERSEGFVWRLKDDSGDATHRYDSSLDRGSGQNSKGSMWICERGTPSLRSRYTDVSTSPAGPATAADPCSSPCGARHRERGM